MSSSTTPISPARFAEALHDLPISTLHLKARELRNSIAHLDYSNEQLQPFADGTDPSLSPPTPDQDCIDAIRENAVVIARMQERIELLKKEVEGRGASWGEFMTAEEIAAGAKIEEEGGEASRGGGQTQAGGAGQASSSPWTDGTFTTGRIVNGEVRMDGSPAGNVGVEGHVNGDGNAVNGNISQLPNGTGGRLGDEELRRRMEERMTALAEEDDEGMHL